MLLPLTLPAACGSVSSMSDSGVASDAPGGGDGPQPRFCDSSDPALAACYEFEPASPPASLLDGSSYGNSGMLSGVSYVAGHDGMAISLSPSNSRVVVPDSTSLDVASLTVEMWVKTDTVVAANARAGLLDDDGQYAVFILPQNVIECASATEPQAATLRLDTTVALDIGRWTHVACTYDGPTMLVAPVMRVI